MVPWSQQMLHAKFILFQSKSFHSAYDLAQRLFLQFLFRGMCGWGQFLDWK